MKIVYILLYTGLAVIAALDERCPLKCDPEKCTNDVSSCNSTTLDDCECCHICVRYVGSEKGDYTVIESVLLLSIEFYKFLF